MTLLLFVGTGGPPPPVGIPAYSTLGIPDVPIVDSWSEPEPYITPTSTDMDGGNIRLRRQPGDERIQRQFDILFTNAQYATFKAYVKTTLGLGTARFQMRVWDGAAMVLETVQFSKPYQPTPMPPLYVQVTFVLWIYP
jgi:hypothetical protein